MDKNKFKSMLELLIPQIVEIIIKEYKITDVEAVDVFYQTKLYSLLEQEDTKLWHFSPLTLFHMFDEERKTGKITFPEGV